jgi:minor histocompatibility antigen H13
MVNVFESYLKLASYFLLVSIHVLAYAAHVPVSVQLFIVSIVTIYLGCLAGITITKDTHAVREKAAGDNAESMSMKDAYLFPVYASAVLFSLYIVIKFVDKEILGKIVSVHFSFLGVVCLMALIQQILDPFLGHLRKNQIFFKPIKWNLVVTQLEFNIDINQLSLVSFFVAMGPTLLLVTTKHWIVNNIFGAAFCISGIQNLVLPNFKIGFVLLWGLFFYDIFWVFRTDVMVTVAKNIDAPIKFLFPIDLSLDPPKFSMLGLGDIVIPGIFIALCLHFDVDRCIKAVKGNLAKVNAIYFKCCLLAYAIGIVVTFACMIIFETAQPALLYLVPACTLSVAGLALFKKEHMTLLNYEEHALRQEVSEKAK